MQHDELFHKIEAAPEGPKKTLGVILVEVMRDYFVACQDANDARKKANQQPIVSTARKYHEAEERKCQGLAEYLESHAVRLANCVEELLDER